MMITNLNSVVDRSPRRKKKKSQSQLQETDHNKQNNDHTKWRTDKQQQLYSSKLIQALSHVRLNQVGGRRDDKAIREAAYRALAVSAKGRTRWSLAILTRLKLKFRKQQNQLQKRQHRVISVATASAFSFRSKKSKFSLFRLTSKSLPSVQRKVKVLGRLVPGCKQETLPVILEEATDYIAALEMQVRAMTALADFLSASASAPPSTG